MNIRENQRKTTGALSSWTAKVWASCGVQWGEGDRCRLLVYLWLAVCPQAGC